MQRRIRPALLTDNAYGTNYPSPTEKVLDVTYLNGGLNLWELDYRLEANQSPDLLNVYWKDGSLSSRQGLAYLSDSTAYGNFCACYEKAWPSGSNNMIAHKGTKLYKIDITTGVHTELTGSVTLTERYGGSFFVFGDNLYYMDGVSKYIKITRRLVASEVEGYIPTVIVNRYYDGTGGSIYQDENRIQAGKRIKFTTGLIPSTTGDLPKTYQVPIAYCTMDDKAVEIKLTSGQGVTSERTYNEVKTVDSLPTTGIADIYYKVGSTYSKYVNGAWTTVSEPTYKFSVARDTGVITFFDDSVPPQNLTQSPSNMEVVVYKDNALAMDNILSCRAVTVYGGDTEMGVVVGGPTSVGSDGSHVSNAYFWSGSNDTSLDPTYFPFDYYNYAGANSDEPIIAFGRQQSMLIIFKEHSIGKSTFEITTSTRDNIEYSLLNLPYTPLNDNIGCDIEKSVRLIQNNLVFANTYGGVYALLDTTAAKENSVKRLSRNVNGDNVLKSSQYQVLEYSSSSSFPETGEIGVYYKDLSTSYYYVWNATSLIYEHTRIAPQASGLMYDLKAVATTAITSFDDGQRYWLTANGKAYVWDYVLSSVSSYEKNMTWFYFDNIYAYGWFKTESDNYFGMQNGKLVKFIDIFNDFGEVIPRRYAFATQNFKTYEVLKDVLKVILAVRSDTVTTMYLKYKTDYEERMDKTPIRATAGWKLVPRNLARRVLWASVFAGANIRIPRCFHIRHFQMVLLNDFVNTDMSVISAQIVYRYSRGDR